MPDRKHNIYRSRTLAVIFMFLNAVCIASTGIKDSADYQQVALQSGVDLNTFGSEESQEPAASLVSQFRRTCLSTPNHNPSFYRTIALLPLEEWHDPAIVQSACLQKPGYYNFLFHYTLF
jgi:hypothetical protein